MRGIFRYVVITLLGLFACQNKKEVSWQNIEKDLQLRIAMAHDGDSIFIPAGHYVFTQPLFIHDKNRLIITGQGESTVLSFKSTSSEAILINIKCSNYITLKKMLLHSAGSCTVLAEDAQHISLIELNLMHDAIKGHDPSSGVCVEHCRDVLIERCFLSKYNGAAVRSNQSVRCEVRYNMIWHNGIGLMLTNTAPADIFHNHIFDNGNGVLISRNATGHHKAASTTVSISFNKIFYNNRMIDQANPPHSDEWGIGIGLVMDRVNDVEVGRNTISKNKTAAILIVSDSSPTVVSAPDSLSCSVAIYHNDLSRGRFQIPDLSTSLGKHIFSQFHFSCPNIIMTNKSLPSYEYASGKIEKNQRICIFSNKGETCYSITE